MPSVTNAELFARYPWLQELPGILGVVRLAIRESAEPAEFAARVRDTQVWKDRFAGLIQRQQKGLPSITEADYLEIERGYRNQLREYGVEDFVGDFTTFAADQIGKDISVSEFNARLDSGYAAVVDSSPLVRDQFREFYGVDVEDQDLFRYFLDPDRGLQEIEEKVVTSKIGAEAMRFGLNVTRTRAELLRSEGVTEDLARQGFADVARELPTINRLARIHSSSPLEQSQLESFFFHEDPEVGAQRQSIFSQALAEFQEGSPVRPNQFGGLSELLDRDRTV